jgi:hypothetical protein
MLEMKRKNMMISQNQNQNLEAQHAAAAQE